MTAPKLPSFPDRGADPDEWRRRGLAPPTVIARWVSDRTKDERPAHEPTYADFLTEPSSDDESPQDHRVPPTAM